MKRFLYYFVWTLAIGLVVYWGMQLQENLVERSEMTYNPFPLRVYVTLFPVIIGLLLRTPKLILDIKERQLNPFDWAKFMSVGLPTLIVLLMTFIPYLPNADEWLPVSIFSLNIFLFSGSTVPTIAGLIFGYVLLDSFKKPDAAGAKEAI